LLSGAVESKSCSYLGIPYAKPPKDALRFAPPQPADGWSGVRDATMFGPACVQGGADLSFASSTGEDCLYLNVWTPMNAPSKPLPVMVFIPGGGYVAGAANIYDPTRLSEKAQAVIVSLNYRLGALGFFASPDLDKQRPDKPSGSDGIRDQQMALQWVHENIATFHGDPNNVTVWGESAGSSAVGVHVVSPGTRGLAQRFIMESGVPTRGPANLIAAVPRDHMYQLTKLLASDLCPNATDTIACLRGLPADKLMNWTPSSGTTAPANWAPVVEGPNGVLPDTPDALLTSGKSNPGPIIVGTNKNEWALFAVATGTPATVADLKTQVQTAFPDSVDQIMSIYAPNDYVDVKEAYLTMMTDAVFRCPTRTFARLASAHNHDVYLYSFEQGTAPHAGELQYVLDYGLFTITTDLTAPVPPLVDAVQGYWTNFVRTGDPNGMSLTTWPKYDTAGDQNITLVNPPDVAIGLEKTACDFWDGYVAKH
jgi:para-nitrobenzyl esterase